MSESITALRHRGVLAAIGAALLFGCGTPIAKVLVAASDPLLLAGLLYAGSGLGLLIYRTLRRAAPVNLVRSDVPWLAAAIAAGGIAGPALLMIGISNMPASGAALLLNAEGVFTAVLAWTLFKENVDRRIAMGMALIVAGAAVLSWPGEARFESLLPSLAVLGACAAWALDNNFTRKVALTDATFIAMVKGLVAGTTNIALAFAIGQSLPAWPVIASAAALGFASYGVSLVLFVVALRELGTARTGAYFSLAPFAGALLAIVMLGEPLTLQLGAAGALMAAGVWLHLTERHAHEHMHRPLVHEHEHAHDEHHQHKHEPGIDPSQRHAHRHEHPSLRHSHSHYPDAHHRHEHNH